MTVMNGAAVRLNRDEARILAHYAAGESRDEIARATSIDHGTIALTIDTVAKNNRNLAQNLARDWQQAAKAAAATGSVSVSAPPVRGVQPAEPIKVFERQIDGIADLLDTAAASDVPRMVRAAERIRGLISELQVQVAEHARDARLRAEQAELERRLAEIRAQIKGGKRAVETPAGPPEARVDTKTIRAWAAANGVDCSAHGRIPGSVLDAYHAAGDPS
jgi:hypothetical protein